MRFQLASVYIWFPLRVLYQRLFAQGGGFWVALVQKVYYLLMNFKCLSCQSFVRVGTTPTA